MAKLKNEASFHIPDTNELLAARMTPGDIERMVTDVASCEILDNAWAYTRDSTRSATSAGVTGSFKMAAASGVDMSDALDVPAWIKTIWRRACC